MADRVGRPQGGMKSEAGKAAYWRMQHESAIGALADLIAEHRELVESIEALAGRWEKVALDACDDAHHGCCPDCIGHFYADDLRTALFPNEKEADRG